jgi:hypothetical protein
MQQLQIQMSQMLVHGRGAPTISQHQSPPVPFGSNVSSFYLFF